MLPALLGGAWCFCLEWATRRWEADVLENQNQGLVRGWKGGAYGLFQPHVGTSLLAPRRWLQLEACRHPVGFPTSLSEIKKRELDCWGSDSRKAWTLQGKEGSECAQGGAEAQGYLMLGGSADKEC